MGVAMQGRMHANTSAASLTFFFALIGACSPVPRAGTITASSSTLNWIAVAGELPRVQTVKLTNNSRDDVIATLALSSLDTRFQIVGLARRVLLQPDEPSEIEIAFDPTSALPAFAVLQIVSGEDVTEVRLRGEV
ncbi:MAG TPA: hypothetical protein VGO62_17015, partial [Myxococcota bacterium]